MSDRVLIPELLDGLPLHDPRAQASRRDLCRINALQGNARWFLKQLKSYAPPPSSGPWVELGAGNGHLLANLHRHFPDHQLIGVDIAPRPAALPPRIEWEQGDAASASVPSTAAVIMANLVLHHFTDDILRLFSERWAHARLILASEPHRHPLSRLQGRLLLPFVHPVTRHDLNASINAGFRPGELAPTLGLVPCAWQVHESASLAGSCRLVAVKHGPRP